mgnify:CR=1 FL=1
MSEERKFVADLLKACRSARAAIEAVPIEGLSITQVRDLQWAVRRLDAALERAQVLGYKEPEWTA